DRHQHGSHAPEGQFAADPAPIDDHIRIKRHRNSPSERSSRESHGILCTALTCRVPITSIAMQNEENKALPRSSPRTRGSLATEVDCRRRTTTQHPNRYSTEYGSRRSPGRHRKRAPVETGALLMWTGKPEAYLSVRCLSAVPRMSPKVAPESEEPYCAIASFSSATSSALIETCTLRAFLSNWITRASTFSPTAKRSARWSLRSRASSERLMKVVKSVPEILTSMPLSLTSSTSQVTTAPFLTSPGSAKGSPSSCLTPSEMRSFSKSTSSNTHLTILPFLKLSITCSPGCLLPK